MENDRFLKRLQFSPQLTEEIYLLILQIDAIKGQWKIGKKLSPQIIHHLQSSVLITSSGASTRIEGSKLSDEEIRRLFTQMRIKEFKTRDQQEVAGYMELLQMVFENWNNMSFAENVILQLHAELLKYSEKDIKYRGKYKFGSNRVEAKDQSGNIIGVVFDPTPPHLVEKEMQELIAWTQNALERNIKHPLLLTANFIFEFLAIHPFQDGNGRLSRILTNLLLLQLKYEYTPYVSHEKIVEENKADYYIALNTTQKSWKTDNEDISSWVLFFLKILVKQSQEALTIIEREDIEKFLSEKQLQVWQFALTQNSFQRKDVIEATQLNARTIEQSIKKLVDMNKLEKLGEGKATRYRVI